MCMINIWVSDLVPLFLLFPCLFLCQCDDIFSTVALQQSLNSGIVMPPEFVYCTGLYWLAWVFCFSICEQFILLLMLLLNKQRKEVKYPSTSRISFKFNILHCVAKHLLMQMGTIVKTCGNGNSIVLLLPQAWRLQTQVKGRAPFLPCPPES